MKKILVFSLWMIFAMRASGELSDLTQCKLYAQKILLEHRSKLEKKLTELSKNEKNTSWSKCLQDAIAATNGELQDIAKNFRDENWPYPQNLQDIQRLRAFKSWSSKGRKKKAVSKK